MELSKAQRRLLELAGTTQVRRNDHHPGPFDLLQFYGLIDGEGHITTPGRQWLAEHQEGQTHARLQ